MRKKYDESINEVLFKTDYFSDFPDDVYDKNVDIALKAVSECDNDSVFEGWFNYLKEKVVTKEQAYSFLAWFFNYGGHELKVKNPYPFLVTLFKKCEFTLKNNQDDEIANSSLDTFDSIYITMLINSKIITIDDYFNVNFYTDKRFLEELNK